MKYYLFAGDWYYPSGGYEDYIGEFDIIEDAKERMENIIKEDLGQHWAHIVKNHKMICKLAHNWDAKTDVTHYFWVDY